ncbi:(2Fe-2S) ferredoxin domain-containing protein [Neobacillus massiliamazoniensis]|uniref:Cobalamin biosynthesis protein n=1 Tax=Neobacillus massiliamazoniensis TaxID=1499688 RepID=A0A0U1NZ37_9BACI|nr:(2Fe-2S) ferredoxin domain-containing protein [Neobacillus massiliamazoniensis]CRK83247.1 cobalamin biosynthesis protein [Neobacillus massiliamazoniensis]
MTTWNLNGTKHHVLICNGSSCMRKGGEEATQAIRNEIANLDLDSFIHTTRTRCNGRCNDAPVAIVYPEGTWYKNVTPVVGSQIVRQHLSGGSCLPEYVIYQYDQEGFIAPESTESIEGVLKPVKSNV